MTISGVHEARIPNNFPEILHFPAHCLPDRNFVPVGPNELGRSALLVADGGPASPPYAVCACSPPSSRCVVGRPNLTCRAGRPNSSNFEGFFDFQRTDRPRETGLVTVGSSSGEVHGCHAEVT